jgi:hypothetical protein
MVLGITSPTTSMTGVRTSVTTSGALPPSTGRRPDVAADEATTWASVTPIIAVDRNRSGRWKVSR